MKAWLLKTEPSTYSYDDLAREKRTVWDGVKNPLALRNLAAIANGDRLFVYHTGDERAVVGIARAVSEAYPDPKKKDPKLLVIDLEPVRRLDVPVPLSSIKASARFRGFDLVRLPRLSVMPVTDEQWAEIERLASR